MHWNFLLFKQLGCNSSATLTGPVFLLSSTFHPPQRFPQGSSPLSQSDLTACPGTPCHRSAQQHTGLSDGPPGRGPSTPLWRRTPSGCPVGGAVEHRYNQVNNTEEFENVQVCFHLCVYVYLCLCAGVFSMSGNKKRGGSHNTSALHLVLHIQLAVYQVHLVKINPFMKVVMLKMFNYLLLTTIIYIFCFL